MNRVLIVIAGLLFLLTTTPTDAQTAVEVKNFKVVWGVTENSHQGKNQFLSGFIFSNAGKTSIDLDNWSLYFNFVRGIKPGTVSNNATIEHVNGDLYRLRFPSGIKLEPNNHLPVDFVAGDWVVNFTDAPAGLYIVSDADKDKGIPVTQYIINPSTSAKQYLRFPGDKIELISAQDIYLQNDSSLQLQPTEMKKIFPTPVEYKSTSAEFLLSKSSIIVADPEFTNEARLLANELGTLVGKNLNIDPQAANKSNVIHLQKGEGGEEAYSLHVDGSGIKITGATSAGIFYGTRSLLTLIDPLAFKSKQSEISIHGVDVTDNPRFGHRALFVDVSRNFQSKVQVLKLLDIMSLYKLNVLHLHLNDDEGWRIEIPGLPELTSIGSRRGHTVDEKLFLQPSFGSGPDVDKTSGSGFYSRKEYIEILQYASARHVTVIPEIEMPGHARAAVKSMDVRYARLMAEGRKDDAWKFLLHHPDDQSKFRSVQGWNDNVMDPALPSVYIFLEKIFDEVISMYREAGAPLETIHCGGDEVPAGVWEKSPAVNELMQKDPSIRTTDDLWYHFYGKVNELLKSRKLFLYGWEEIAMRKTKLDGKGHNIPNPDFVGKGFQVDVWNNVLGWGAEDLAYQLANSGYKVVLSCVSHLYFDMAYHKAFDEPGYYWGGFTDIDKPFSFIPYDYFRNSREDKFGAPLDRSVFIGKERLTEYGQKNIIGIQGLLWAENITSAERMEYMIMPKIFGLAERAWAQDPAWATETGTAYREHFNADYSRFLYSVGQRELMRLDHFKGGFLYRIPAPGLKIEGDVVKANIQFPGLQLKYTNDGREPTMKSAAYTGPIKKQGIVKVRAFNSKGRGGKTAEMKINEVKSKARVAEEN